MTRHPSIARATAVGGALLLVAGAAGAIRRRLEHPPELPRRYADYLPVTTGETLGDQALRLAPLVGAAGLLLLAAALAAQADRRLERLGGIARHAVTTAGGLLVVGGLVGWFLARHRGLTDSGWFMYAPLTDPATAPSPFTAPDDEAVCLLIAALGAAAAVSAPVVRRLRRRHDGRDDGPDLR